MFLGGLRSELFVLSSDKNTIHAARTQCPDAITDRGIRQYFGGDLKNINPSQKKTLNKQGRRGPKSCGPTQVLWDWWVVIENTAEGEQVDSLEYTDMSFVRGIFFHAEA